MTFPKRNKLAGGEFTQVEFSNDKLLVQKNETPAIINKSNREAFLKLVQNLHEAGEKQDIDGLQIEVLKKTTGDNSRVYYKMTYKGKDYFVKKTASKDLDTFGGGATEVILMSQAKQVLTGQEKVKVASYELGYQDNYNAYLVSDYDSNLSINLKQYLLSNPINKNDLLNRIKKIKEVLIPYFHDVKDYNMAYDQEADTIIVFDLSLRDNNKVDDEKIFVD